VSDRTTKGAPVSRDLRLGTYGNWLDGSFCVWGEDLVAEVAPGLTELLGPSSRDRAPRVWSFGG